MITASHNPKEDNGYKVYGANGSQIKSPTEGYIAALIPSKDRVLWALPKTINTNDPFELIQPAYISGLTKLFKDVSFNPESQPNIVYTPMHGVGGRFVEHLLRVANLPPFILVKEQLEPDPEFPTVKFPNPEEGRGALELAMKCAENAKAKVIFANDPDADRFNFAEYNQQDGAWKIFNGNEIALLLADFCWRHLRDKARPLEKICMISSLVSSKILKSMAEKEGFCFQQAATGFKNISNAGQEMEKKGYQVLLSYEEAIGFMVGTLVWDKDGISALLTANHLVNELYANNSTLSSHLDSLYQKYGYHVQFNSYYYCQNAQHLPSIINNLSANVESLQIGHQFGTEKLVNIENNKTSKVLLLNFERGTWIAIRASGTEPKVKFYSEALVTDKNLINENRQSLCHLVIQVCEALINPHKYELTLHDF